MVKNGKKRSKSGKSKEGWSPSAEARTVPFFTGYVFDGSLVSGGASFDCNPNQVGITRLDNVAQGFAEYRLKKLRFRLLNQISATPVALQGACYIPGITDTGPATAVQVSEVPGHVINGAGQSIPSKWVTVQGNAIRGMFPWYKTIPGSLDPAEESCGKLYIFGSGTDKYSLEVQFWYEFRLAIDPASTPAMRYERMVLREQARLKKILSFTPASPVTQSLQPPITALPRPGGF
jgi:hypothetical protein